MPYISQFERGIIDRDMGRLLEKDYTAGQLNYIITKLLLAQRAKNYEEWNSLMGVLASVQLELYRRHVAPYEDTKLASQGDVTV